jgi:hypothetical protein
LKKPMFSVETLITTVMAERRFNERSDAYLILYELQWVKKSLTYFERG